MPESPQIPMLESSFKSNCVHFDVSTMSCTVRFLKMNSSCFIYIGVTKSESLDEIGIAMPATDTNPHVVATVALGPQLGCDSEQLAQKLAKRLNKPVYVSCNLPFDRMLMPIIEKKLIELIQTNPDLV